jgi:hypothetical protein
MVGRMFGKNMFGNFVVKAPSHSLIFYKSINTSGTPPTGAAVSSAIEEVIVEIGARKFDSIITDNANVMQAAWKILEDKFFWIQAYGCAAHAMNLVIKDFLAIQEYSKTNSEASKIIQFVNNHHIANFLFVEKCKEANVTRKLTTIQLFNLPELHERIWIFSVVAVPLRFPHCLHQCR